VVNGVKDEADYAALVGEALSAIRRQDARSGGYGSACCL